MFLCELIVNSVSSPGHKEWTQEVVVNKTSVNFKLDTVLDYNKNPIPIIGTCILNCVTEKIQQKLKFVVCDLNSSPILGLQAFQSLGLIQRLCQLNKTSPADQPCTVEQVLEEFQDVFSGMGRLNRTVKINLKPDSIPHVAAPRKIPLALHDRVKKELENMEEQGIIVRVEEPTEWVSNMVVVDSPKKLRICIDPRPLNEAIRRPHYPIPASERLFTNLQGCTVFSLLDAKKGFWQLPLEDASSYLTTFSTPWGRYRFLVLPFGLNNAPEEFQRAMEEIFEAESQIQPYFDDIALSSKNLQEHCDLLRKALTIARKENLKFNPSKMQIAKSSITYLGHRISEEGIKPDPVKVQGKQLIVADTLSRATCPYVFDEESQSPPSVHASVLAIATSPRWKQLTEMTLQDRVLQVVSRYVTTG
ncbi:hypothetical protein JTE90_029481 [Oedothorax gibbosus]|uniref:Reverse transcriptase domain-containing protein n=1 Tax=Oedothorax gibbosus TaxID=931172 RepID=A0AAV6V536_9ARAC|nr:hypothetical protein JTE90_029481 [Oedothorax gibbosus]